MSGEGFVGRPGQHVVVVNWKDRGHPAAGGAELFCTRVAEQLRDAGLRVTYLTSRSTGQRTSEDVEGIRCVRLPGGTYGVYPAALAWLLAHRQDVDAVLDSQNGIPFFTPLVLPRTTPVVQVIHHVHQEQFGLYFPKPVAALGRWLESSAARRVYGTRALAVVSPSSRTEVRKQLRLRGEITVTPNGQVVPDDVHPRSTAPTIACVGRLVPHKRWDLLLRAVPALLQTLPDLQVDLVGDGPSRAALQQLRDELGLGDVVHLHGFVDEQTRDALLGRAWLTVSTSVGEGWGLAVLESAALGVPAVAFDVPGLRDAVLDGVTGWLVATEPELTHVLATALHDLRQVDVAAARAELCRGWARQLSWESTARRLMIALVDEAQRLSTRQGRRRVRPDIATIVELDAAASADLRVEGLRNGDQTTFCPDCRGLDSGVRRVLLRGADEEDALSVLRRLGVQPTAPVSVRIARPRDILTWSGGAVAHDVCRGTVYCPLSGGVHRQLAAS